MADSKTGIAEHVSRCLQLAILLEVSGHPKPGNVHRTADFRETHYEHFLASAVAVVPHLRHAAQMGIMVSEGKIRREEAAVGAIIRGAVENVIAWQRGKNTLLGSIILLSPMAVAAGMTLAEAPFSIEALRENLKSVVESTTPRDAVDVYDAISMARPGGLGSVSRLDVNDPASKGTILENRVTLLEVFRIASEYDSIASEWVENYPITFNLGYPYFSSQLEETEDVNTATVHTFLKILSEVPDTLITRKAGLAESRRVSERARLALEAGGLVTPEGRRRIRVFDESLRESDNRLNPGTTADIVAAVLAIAILNGYRP